MTHFELKQKILRVEIELGEIHQEIRKLEKTEKIDIDLALKKTAEAMEKTGAAYYCIVDDFEIEKKEREKNTDLFE